MPITPAHAGETCTESTKLNQASRECPKSASEVQSDFASAESDGFTYRIRLWCHDRISERDVQCVGPPTPCSPPEGGTLYEVFRARVDQPTAWTNLGRSCLGAGDVATLGTITPELVLTEFRKLTWPQAELIVQPVGGETLVNFPTNFYTENTEPTSQEITLLGARVTIEATPTSYTWHFDDGSSVDSRVPGLPAPDPDVRQFSPEELEESPSFVTHRYVDAHVVEQPSVNVTYTGRYRIGSGRWTDIPDTLTVAGDPVNLSIIEGIPHLVGSP